MNKIFKIFLLLILIIFLNCTSIEINKRFNLPSEYEYIITATSVKNQERTGTCWAYDSVSFIESETIRKGLADTTLDLSEIYIVYYTYVEKSREYLKRMGVNNFSEGGLDFDTTLVISKYGIVRESDYKANNKGYHEPVVYKMSKILSETVSNYKKIGSIPDDVIEETLNKIKEELNYYFGTIPKIIIIDNKEITPIDYAKNILKIDVNDYVTLTSYCNFGYYEYVELSIPDNWQHYNKYINVKIEDMINIAQSTLKQGYSISCDADVSEPLINWEKGYFRLTDKEILTDYKEIEKLRLEQFEEGLTTDDHAMHIIGFDEDDDWFYLKNSWGEYACDNGYLHMPPHYFNLKVLAITVNKEVLQNFKYIFPQ